MITKGGAVITRGGALIGSDQSRNDKLTFLAGELGLKGFGLSLLVRGSSMGGRAV